MANSAGGSETRDDPFAGGPILLGLRLDDAGREFATSVTVGYTPLKGRRHPQRGESSGTNPWYADGPPAILTWRVGANTAAGHRQEARRGRYHGPPSRRGLCESSTWSRAHVWDGSSSSSSASSRRSRASPVLQARGLDHGHDSSLESLRQLTAKRPRVRRGPWANDSLIVISSNFDE